MGGSLMYCYVPVKLSNQLHLVVTELKITPVGGKLDYTVEAGYSVEDEDFWLHMDSHTDRVYEEVSKWLNK
jgi:hypothetical protein